MSTSPGNLDHLRLAAQTRLERAVGERRLTLEQYSDQASVVWSPTARESELDAIAPNTVEPVPTSARAQSTMVSLFGDVKRAGRWALAASTTAVLIFGDVKLDLRSAVIGARESVITALSIFGDTTVVVPSGVNVEVAGFDLFGDREVDLGTKDPGTHAPTIRIRSYSLFGDLKVRAAWGA